MARFWLGAGLVVLLGVGLLVYTMQSDAPPGEVPPAESSATEGDAPAVAPAVAQPRPDEAADEVVALADEEVDMPAEPEVAAMLQDLRDGVITALRDCDVRGEAVSVDVELAVEGGRGAVSELVPVDEDGTAGSADWMDCVTGRLDALELSGPDGNYPVRLELAADELD